jgi:hypothetical protein
MEQDKYELIRDHYWVLAWKWERRGHDADKPSWSDWVFAIEEPQPVLNPYMCWRRPTYEDTLHRQGVYDDDAKYWFERLDDHSLCQYDRR